MPAREKIQFVRASVPGRCAVQLLTDDGSLGFFAEPFQLRLRILREALGSRIELKRGWREARHRAPPRLTHARKDAGPWMFHTEPSRTKINRFWRPVSPLVSAPETYRTRCLLQRRCA